VIKWCFERDIFPIVLGGGHETAFGHYLGYASTAKNMHCINIDAHLDVRPYPDGPHSGSPFRQMLESKPTSCQRYDIIGVQRHSASAEHMEFVRNHGEVVFRESLRPQTAQEVIKKSELPIYLSIDLDVIDQSVASGVSAPAVNGLKLQELIDIVVPIAQSGRLASVEIVELNPRFDVDNHTARLAAWIVYTLIEKL
jgi:formiminoglutamase